jgi:hypothetical protein
MKTFESVKEVTSYLAIKYPKSKGKEMVSWHVSDLLLLIGVYEGEHLMEGFFIYKNPSNNYKWTIIDNIHAELAVLNYIQYLQEMQQAIAVSHFLIDFEEDENDEEFYETLD